MGKRGPTPGSAHAAHGGNAVKAKLGIPHYQRIGKLGGEAVMERYGAGFYAEIGCKGGTTTLQRHGAAHYQSIGKRVAACPSGGRCDSEVVPHVG